MTCSLFQRKALSSSRTATGIRSARIAVANDAANGSVRPIGIGEPNVDGLADSIGGEVRQGVGGVATPAVVQVVEDHQVDVPLEPGFALRDRSGDYTQTLSRWTGQALPEPDPARHFFYSPFGRWFGKNTELRRGSQAFHVAA